MCESVVRHRYRSGTRNCVIVSPPADWKDEFDAESSNQFRRTLADESLNVDEEDRRREIARKWEHLQRRIKIVGFVIREWDFLASTTEPSEALSLKDN